MFMELNISWVIELHREPLQLQLVHIGLITTIFPKRSFSFWEKQLLIIVQSFCICHLQQHCRKAQRSCGLLCWSPARKIPAELSLHAKWAQRSESKCSLIWIVRLAHSSKEPAFSEPVPCFFCFKPMSKFLIYFFEKAYTSDGDRTRRGWRKYFRSSCLRRG